MGKGSTWRMRIPLTLAIQPSLTVESHGELYAIPQASLLELVALDSSRKETSMEYVNSSPVYRLRGMLLPLIRLSHVLHPEERIEREEESNGVIAVLQNDDQRFGLVVDKVINNEEIVVKALSSKLKSIGLYAGATLLGDGRVALILDIGFHPGRPEGPAACRSCAAEFFRNHRAGPGGWNRRRASRGDPAGGSYSPGAHRR